MIGRMRLALVISLCCLAMPAAAYCRTGDTVCELVDRVEALERDRARQRKQIEELEGEARTLHLEVERLERRLEDQKRDIEVLR